MSEDEITIRKVTREDLDNPKFIEQIAKILAQYPVETTLEQTCECCKFVKTAKSEKGYSYACTHPDHAVVLHDFGEPYPESLLWGFSCRPVEIQGHRIPFARCPQHVCGMRLMKGF